MPSFTHCFVDESIHDAIGVVATAFVFGDQTLQHEAITSLKKAGLDLNREEYKSSIRMDADIRMQRARTALISLASSKSKIAVFFGPFFRPQLGKQTLQALQSVMIRNGIECSSLSVYFDQEIFPNEAEAQRLKKLFRMLDGSTLYPKEDSKICIGIQIADAVAYYFGQIIKAAITGKDKQIRIGGENTGYSDDATAPLSWDMLMSLRYALLIRPVAQQGQPYSLACDPVVLDPSNDDPVPFCQNPVLFGWGVQVAPEADRVLRRAVEDSLGTIWLGCIH